MKKYTYTFFVLFFAVLIVAIVIYKGNEKVNATPTLLERTGSMAKAADWQATKSNIETLLAQLKNSPNNNDVKLKLAAAFTREGRATGNYQYYNTEALQLLNAIINDGKEDARGDNIFQALCIKSSIYLNQHHFADAMKIAEQARRINPYNSFVYGCLTDANIELGNYQNALVLADSMCAIRPDLRSYSRISYLREIFGKNQAAIDAMKMAVGAGIPGLEETEWARVQLARLYENLGRLDTAEGYYRMSLFYKPDYPFALAGMGRISVSKNNFSEAIKYYEQAITIMPDESFIAELSDAYKWNKQMNEAENSAEKLIAGLNKKSTTKDENNVLHNADKELASAYLKINDLDNALSHALTEYNRRPDNIDVNDLLAWVYYKKGDYSNATKYIKVAMKTNKQNTELLCHAGLIMMKSGDNVNGLNYLSLAKQMNINLNPDLAAEIKPYTATVKN